MPEEILINIISREVRVAFLEKGVLQDVYIERTLAQSILGNIYKGRVNRLLPGIQAAFVDIGLDRAAFLHLSDIHTSKEVTDIREILRPGQVLLVQVYKNQLGEKGARLTTNFSIPFRYLVLTPGSFRISCSQKITDEDEQKRLVKMITPGQYGGYVFRTAAQGVSEKEIKADKLFLDQLWAEIQDRATQVKPLQIVHAEIPMVLRILRDFVSFPIKKIRVDHHESMIAMREFANRHMPDIANCIEYHNECSPIFDMYAVEDQLQKALERKVTLKSGGHVIFDQTEAMTTIDVNTGSYTGKSPSEQIILRTNLEAVDIISQQIRLRNLGGIIIIDFIDLVYTAHQKQLISKLKSAFAQDVVKTHISELSSLGLVQLTRKRARESLEHILCSSCPACQGRGSIKSIKTICYEILRGLKRAANYNAGTGLQIKAAPAVIEEILDKDSETLALLESQLKKVIQVHAEAAYRQDYFEIIPTGYQ